MSTSPPVVLTVSYRYDGEGQRLPEGQGIVLAHDDGHLVGALRWDFLAEPPVVEGITVEETHRRRGIATALWREAASHQSGLVHSDTLTDDGQRWIASLG